MPVPLFPYSPAVDRRLGITPFAAARFTAFDLPDIGGQAAEANPGCTSHDAGKATGYRSMSQPARRS